MAGAPIRELLFVEALGMRGCQSPGAGRCITAPGKVSGSRRFYVIIRGTAWSGGAVATETANAPKPTFTWVPGIVWKRPFEAAGLVSPRRRTDREAGSSGN